ncbi:MAG: hypothetical protein ACTSYT_03720 [Candidatus Asgardarchaeia archaeon]
MNLTNFLRKLEDFLNRLKKDPAFAKILIFLGSIQTTLGVFVIILGYIVHFNVYNIQGIFEINVHTIGILITFIFSFGLVSIISGITLMNKSREIYKSLIKEEEG